MKCKVSQAGYHKRLGSKEYFARLEFYRTHLRKRLFLIPETGTILKRELH